MALRYDPEAGYLVTAFRVTNTVVPLVLSHGEFWALIGLHLLVCWAFRSGYLQSANEKGGFLSLDWNEMKVISAATTFFEVFYTNSCFSRYNSLYDLSRSLLGNIYDFAFEIRLHLRKTSQSHVRLAARWFAASVILFFYETNADVSDREWEELLRQGLLKPDEKQFLASFHRHQRSLILLQWSGEVIRDGCSKAQTAANVVKSLVDKLQKSRALEQTVVDTIDLPLPFQYFHLLNMMVVVNLLLWAYAMGTTESLFAPFCFFFAALIFMGMLELAAALSDPFGDDEVDFPVADWMNEFLENMIVLIEFDSPIPMDSRLAAERPLRTGKRHLNLFLGDNLAASPAQSFASSTRSARTALRPPQQRWMPHNLPQNSRLRSGEQDDEDEDEGSD
mmetsp:Transcript_30443/g.87306  ORF Transcript_30443/g.87306 Transcript_30443/m.87306 type:complete len:392 (-) Transcript_30443:175-1350(-)